MGGPIRSRREVARGSQEAIRIIRLFWSGERTISFEGRYYSVSGLHPGPPACPPDRDLAGRRQAACAAHRPPGRRLGLAVDELCAARRRSPDLQRRIDEAAAEAGRHPLNSPRVPAAFQARSPTLQPVSYSRDVEHWVETLTGFALELGFDTHPLARRRRPPGPAASRRKWLLRSAERSSAPAAGAARQPSSATRRTILPRLWSPRLRSNARRASASGKTSSIAGRNSPSSASRPSSTSCSRLGSTTK